MLNLRAHHLFCIQGYLGNGYSKKFTENMDMIVGRLKANPNKTLKVINKVDDICKNCGWFSLGYCNSQLFKE